VDARQTPWEIMVDLFFYRDPEEIEKQEQEEKAAKTEGELSTYQNEQANADWGNAGEWDGQGDDWNATAQGQPVQESWGGLQQEAGAPAFQ